MPGFLDTVLTSTKHPIYLRCLRLSDAAAVAHILSNPENNKYERFSNREPMKIEEAETAINAMRKSASEEVPTRVNLVVVYTGGRESRSLPHEGNGSGGEEEEEEEEEEEIVIGLSGFGGIDLIDGKRFADVGAMIEPEYRGRGYAFECLKLSIDFAFEKLKTDGVSCQTQEANAAMIGLLEKLGWKGAVKQQPPLCDLRYEMSPEDWVEMKKKMKD
ncbi:hypothetical protein B7463_g1313, partial [Scytalidium lignicola]